MSNPNFFMRRSAWAALLLVAVLFWGGAGICLGKTLNVIVIPDPKTGQTVEVVADQVLIGFNPGTTAEEKEAVVSALGATVVRKVEFVNVWAVQMPAGTPIAQAIAAAQKVSRVQYAEPNYVLRPEKAPNDPLFPTQWHHVNMKSAQGWDLTTGQVSNPGDRVPIAIVDTGVHQTHEDLQANLWINPGEIPGNGVDDDNNGYVDDINGWDFVDNQPDTSVGDPHGTSVAGLASAVGNNALGVAGVSWGSAIMCLQFFDDQGMSSVDAELAALAYAKDKKAKVSNHSYGYYGPPSTPEQQAFAALIAADCVVCASNGNAAVDTDVMSHYPGDYPGVLNVASTTQTDAKADFSNWGSSCEVAAPGVDLVTTESYAGDGGARYTTSFSGTSGSSPLAAGCVALMRTRNPGLKQDEIVQLVKQTADNIDALNPAYAGKLGGGRLNVQMAVASVKLEPQVTFQTPLPNSTIYTVTPTIRVWIGKMFPTAPDLKVNTVVMSLDGVDRVSQALGNLGTYFNSTTGLLTYPVTTPLTIDRHVITVQAKDVQNNAVTPPAQAAFRVGPKGVLPGVRMVSVPYTLANSAPAYVLQSPTAEVARWEPLEGDTPGRYHRLSTEPDRPEVNQFVRGRGYWVNLVAASTMRLEGTEDVSATLFKATEEYQIGTQPLRVGWHQIGNPFASSVGWGSVLIEKDGERVAAAEAESRGWISGNLYWYDPTAPAPGYQWAGASDAVMNPFEGYWVRTRVPVTIYIPPLTAQGASVTSRAPGRAPVGGWSFRLAASAGSITDAANILGVAASASDEADVLDVEKPPSPYLSIGSVHADWGSASGVYAQDLRSTSPGTKTWEIEVTSSLANTDVALTWGDLRTVPRDVMLTLTDADSGQKVFMRTQPFYTFTSGPSGGVRHFKVTAVTGAPTLRWTGPLTIMPSRGGVSIGLSLSQPAVVQVEVMNLVGMVVARPADNVALGEGRSTIMWDGRDASGSLLPPGPYLVKVTAESSDGQRLSDVRTFVSSP